MVMRMSPGGIARAALAVAGAGLVAWATPFAITAIFFPTSGLQVVNAVLEPDFRVTVVFDSLTVVDSRDGFLSGTGEYDVVAYVQGVKVQLTEASQSTEVCGGFGGCDLTMWDAHDDETFTFVPGTQVTVGLRSNQPLSVFTAGVEVDGCGRRPFPETTGATVGPTHMTLPEIFKNPALDWFHAVESFEGFVRQQTRCTAYNDNDILGHINKFFDPPSYEAGKHADKVSNGDFEIRYTINVVQPGANSLNKTH